jgi:hypothetical protein
MWRGRMQRLEQLRTEVARVGLIPKNRSQCFQTLEAEVQNESILAIHLADLRDGTSLQNGVFQPAPHTVTHPTLVSIVFRPALGV